MFNRRVFVATFLVAVLSIMMAMPVMADTTGAGKYEKATKTTSRIFGDDDIIEEDEKTGEVYFWQKVDNEWVCTDPDGEPVQGWAPRGDNMYYLNKQGQLKTGWIKDDGKWYYLYSEDDVLDPELVGTLAKDTWIDNYYVDKFGVQKKIKK